MKNQYRHRVSYKYWWHAHRKRWCEYFGFC